MDPLNPIEVRVLGALIEKAITTPDAYPLSLNSLTHACNQSSNRDPVVGWDEGIVGEALETLRRKNLVHVVDRGDSRVTRYRHVAPDTWSLSPAETAVLGVLMLRGPQTVGEIRTRTARLHDFPTLTEVEEVLDGLIGREPDPFVARLPRQTGQKEVRYVHRLSGEIAPPAEASGSPSAASPETGERLATLEDTTEALRTELAELRREFEQFRKEFQ